MSIELLTVDELLPVRQDWEHKAGATWRRRFVWHAAGVPVILTGWDALMRFSSTLGQVVDLTPGDGLTIDGAAGSIDAVLEADDASLLVPGCDVELALWPIGGDRTVLIEAFMVITRSNLP